MGACGCCLLTTLFLYLLAVDLVLVYFVYDREMDMRFDKNENCKCSRPSDLPLIGTSQPSHSELPFLVLVTVLNSNRKYKLRFDSESNQIDSMPLTTTLPTTCSELTRPFRTISGPDQLVGYCTGVGK